MIRLEFQVDAPTLAEDTREDLRHVDAAVLQHNYFDFPVRFTVDDVELFEGVVQDGPVLRPRNQDASNPWWWLPILHLASVGLDRVKEAGQRGYAECTLPGGAANLVLTAIGDHVLIRSGVNQRTVQVDYNDLVTAFEGLAAQTRSVLLQAAPELADHLV